MKKFTTLMFAMLAFGLNAGPAGADHVECGDVIAANTTLDKNIGPCVAGGVTVAAGITLDLNHKRIKGTGAGYGITIDGDDVTVLNGSVQGFKRGISIVPGRDGATIDGVTVKKIGSGIYIGKWGGGPNASVNVSIRNTKIVNAVYDGLVVIDTENFLVENSKITNVGRGTQYQSSEPDGDPCGTGNGIFIWLSVGASILNNKINQVGQSGLLYWGNDNGIIDGNEIAGTSSRPCVVWSTDYGAITIIGGSTNTVVSNNVVTDNEDSAIGLYGSSTTTIENNFLARNTNGIFFIAGDSGTVINDNCIFNNDPSDGLIISDGPDYTVDATYNFWGAADGPSGDGPLGATLLGSGENIVQKDTDNVTVNDFLLECHLSEAEE